MYQPSDFQNRLLSAVHCGKSNDVKALIDSCRGSLCKPWSEGYEALCLSIKHDKQEIMEILLSRGCGVNSNETKTDTPLHLSMWKGNLGLIKSLLINGASIDAQDQTGCTALHLAVRYGHILIVKHLLDHEVSLNKCSAYSAAINLSNQDGKSPLHLAVERNRYEIVKLLLEYNADVNKRTKDDITAMYIASSLENKLICELLIKFGADVNISDRNGISPLHLAVNGATRIAAFLLENNADVNKRTKDEVTPLHVASKYENKEMCEMLIKFGADVNISSTDGKSPLFVAVEENSYKTAEVLLQNRADVNKPTNENITPIFLSTSQNNKEMCELLLLYGANPNVADKEGHFLLHIAVERNWYDIVELLLRYKADVSRKCKGEISPIYIAAGNKNKEICELLLKFGANANDSDINGFSPLHLAVKRTPGEIVEVVTRNNFHGAEVEKKNTQITIFNNTITIDKKSLAPEVVKQKDEEVCELLLQYGACPEISDEEGKSLLHIAVERNWYEVAKLLLKNDADVNKKYNGNITPIYLSAVVGGEKLFSLLLKYGAKIDVNLEKENKSLLHQAFDKESHLIASYILENCKFSQENLNDLLKKALIKKSYLFVKKLVQCGCHLSADEVHDAKIVSTVIKRGFYEIFEDLLSFGLDVNMPIELNNDYSTCSVLHIGVEYKQYRMVDKLLRAEATVDCKDDQGLTPLHIAVLSHDLKLAELLLDCGADYNCEDNNGLKPRHLAFMRRNNRLLGLFRDRRGRNAFMNHEEFSETEASSERIFQRYKVKMQVANLPLNKYYAQLNFNTRVFLTVYTENYQEKCQTEIAMMKSENIADTEISFYDILNCSLTDLAVLMKKQNFVNVVNSTIWKEKYPIYKSILEPMLDKAKMRRELLDKSENMLCTIFPFLPMPCAENILSYFTNLDLKRLVGT